MLARLCLSGRNDMARFLIQRPLAEGSLMLPARHRLRRPQDFVTVLRYGRRIGQRFLIVYCYEGNQEASSVAGDSAYPGIREPAPLVGFVVGRTIGTAVTRNLVKRRLRHLVGERVHRFSLGSMLVIRALPPAASASPAELAADLDRAFNRGSTSGARS